MANKKDIKYGQVWTDKEDGSPVCVVAVAKDGVQIEWFWSSGNHESDIMSFERLLDEYRPYADSMAYHDFREWCISNKIPGGGVTHE